MSGYDKYYKTPNLFGQAFPALIHFLKKHPLRGKFSTSGVAREGILCLWPAWDLK